MVIGIDASRANKPQRTGTEWYSYHVIEHLKRVVPSDVRVWLYTREPLRGDLADLPPNWESRVLVWPPKYLWTLMRLSWEILRRPPDTLFVPAHGLPLVLPKRTVVTIHDIGFMRLPELYRRRAAWYHRWVVRRAFSRAEVVVTVSDWTRREIERVFGASKGMVMVIPLAHDVGRYHEGVSADAARRVQERYGIRSPYFVYAGRVEKKKNIRRMLKAFANFKIGDQQGYSLALIGPRGYGVEEAEAVAKGAGVVALVRFLNWVPEDDMPALMAGARALVFPSLYEGFGIPILEAMAVGTPVITSDQGAMKEVAGNAALLVNPIQVEAIAHALHQVATDAALVGRLRRAGFKRAAEFSWQRTAEETWKVLTGTVGG